MRKITRRSFLAAAAACGAAAALSACGGSSASSAAASSVASSTAASVSAAADGQKFTIGICQLVQHAALDAATQGFEDALTAAFGDNVPRLPECTGRLRNLRYHHQRLCFFRCGSDHGQRDPCPAGGSGCHQHHPGAGHLGHRVRRGSGSG